jgi:Flp pilus assembly protein TadD
MSPPDPKAPRAYALVPRTIDFDGPFDTGLFHQLDALHAQTQSHRDVLPQSLATTRGYDEATLFALAEIAHHYVLSGGTRLALVIFEGLTAVAPKEPYFVLGLAYTLDRAGRLDDAIAAYRRALGLSPRDARTHLNLGELLWAQGALSDARAHLDRAVNLAATGDDEALHRKARALAVRARRIR